MGGLRALGAGMVLAHHAASLVGAGGVVGRLAAVADAGVAIFFVLSGFLIYLPFAAAHHQRVRPPQARTFLWRRAVRILPAYWLALTVLWSTGLVQIDGDAWRYYLLLQVYDATTTLGGIVPAWSLCTEVSFYLFIPLWSFGLRRLAPLRHVGWRLESIGLVVLVAGAYVSRALIDRSDRVWAAIPGHAPAYMRETAFAWFPTNCDLFAVGMALAVVWVATDGGTRLRGRADRLACSPITWWLVAGLLYTAFALVARAPALSGGYHGWYWQVRQLTFSLVGLCLLIPVVFGDRERSRLLRALDAPVIVIAGGVSYGFYLWHHDLLQQVPRLLSREPDAIPFVVAVVLGGALGLAAGYGSWRFVERPVQRRLKRPL